MRKRTLDDQIRAQYTHCANTDTGFGGTVGSAETCEDDGRCAAHRTKEGLLWSLATVHVSQNFMMRVGGRGYRGDAPLTLRCSLAEGGEAERASATYGINGAVAAIALAVVH
jgi:hypothetical protein